MHVVVFGANGRVGSKLVGSLLAEGHTVTAFIHQHSGLAEHRQLQLARGDIHNPADVAQALAGADAVASALGSWGTATKDILATGMRHIIPAMEAAGIRRIVSLTGAGAFDIGNDRPGWPEKLNRWLLRLVAPQILYDGEEHIGLLRASKLDWTVLRAPVMLERSRRGYVLTSRRPVPWATICRDDVVTAMVRLISSEEQLRAAPFISRR